jgi:hypothetical protein
VTFRVLPDAFADALEIALWYDNRRNGLGEEFLGELKAALQYIRETQRLFLA